jgi:hypothetical protein
MMVVEVHPPHATTVTWFGGEANRLSDETIEYPLIEEIHAVTKQLAPVAPVLRWERWLVSADQRSIS